MLSDASVSPLGKSCILLVDDHVETCEFLTAILRRRGLPVMAVCDSAQAKALLESGLRPSLLLTDQNMPGLTGLDLVTLLRTSRNTERVPVIVLSAARIPPRADPYTVILRKPFDAEAIGDLVEELSGVSAA